MNLTSRMGKTCEKTFCCCVVAGVVALTLVALTTVVMIASNTGFTGMFKVLFPD